ncbi:MAG: hypothetical protein ACYDBB_04995 [Armatimonadota bacterium]
MKSWLWIIAVAMMFILEGCGGGSAGVGGGQDWIDPSPITDPTDDISSTGIDLTNNPPNETPRYPDLSIVFYHMVNGKPERVVTNPDNENSSSVAVGEYVTPVLLYTKTNPPRKIICNWTVDLPNNTVFQRTITQMSQKVGFVKGYFMTADLQGRYAFSASYTKSDGGLGFLSSTYLYVGVPYDKATPQ